MRRQPNTADDRCHGTCVDHSVGGPNAGAAGAADSYAFTLADTDAFTGAGW